jgi:hypothetical protein
VRDGRTAPLIFAGFRSGRGTEGGSHTQRQDDIFWPRQAVQLTMNPCPQRAVKLTGDGANERK